MLRKSWKYLLSMTLGFATASSVQAIPITGSIEFDGNFVQNGGTPGNLATATSLSVLNITINAVNTTGAFVGAGAPIAFANPIGVNGNPPSLVGNQLWSVVVGSVTYGFIVQTEAQTVTSASKITFAGSGFFTDGNPADNTVSTWQLSFGSGDTSPSWQSKSGTASVPDGGTTAMLLTVALSGLEVLRRKLA